VKRALLLFDIDGTLLSTNGLAGRALGRAMREVYGTAGPIDTFSWSGKTDPQIVRELLSAAGLPPEDIRSGLPRALARYLLHLEEALVPGSVQVLPGVIEILEELRRRGDVAVGLLTGNIAGGARIKLTAGDLAHHFTVGAFGSDDEDRDRLVPVARRRARARFHDDFPGSRTIVVGDAEADIRCARAGDARAVAVASGWTGRDVLAALAPNVLLDSLATPGALHAILASDRPRETGRN
jgi:phosphoglycolate phosphatase